MTGNSLYEERDDIPLRARTAERTPTTVEAEYTLSGATTP
jgi:hypothetical protein